MFKKLQKRIRKGYCIDGERLSWAPFPSYGLVGEGLKEKDVLENVMMRICRYYGGETVSLLKAKEEGFSIKESIDIEEKGYFYGTMSTDSVVLERLERVGRVVIYLPKSASSGLVEYAYKNRVRENVFLISAQSLAVNPYRLLSDLLYFITNHEGPVIINDFMKEYFSSDDSSCTVGVEATMAEMDLSQFREALEQGDVLNQDDKFYRVN